MSFRVNNRQLLEKYNKIWEKFERLMGIDFENKPVYGNDDKYIKIKRYADSMVINFHNKKIPKEKAPCNNAIMQSIMLDFLIKVNKKYYHQTFLKECKYVQEKIKNENYIDDDLKSDSDSNEETKYDKDECEE